MTLARNGEDSSVMFNRLTELDPIGMRIGVESGVGDASGGAVIVAWAFNSDFMYLLQHAYSRNSVPVNINTAYEWRTGEIESSQNPEPQENILGVDGPTGADQIRTMWYPPSFFAVPSLSPTALSPLLRISFENVNLQVWSCGFRMLFWARDIFARFPLRDFSGFLTR